MAVCNCPVCRCRLIYERRGFTLIELLIVIAIIGILAAVVIVAINPMQRFQEAYLSQAKEQLATIARASQVYQLNNGGRFPADVDRDLPAEIMKELKGSNWPKAPWPGSVYDWDVDPVDGINPTYAQISIRFCDIGGNNCNFPTFAWAEDFDSGSSVYYCIFGNCRAHRTLPDNHPGYCVNCNGEQDD